MSIYTVTYTKRNSFFKNSHDIMEIGEDGRRKIVGKYNKTNAPGAVRIYKPKFVKGRFLVDLTQKQLDAIVAKIGFLDKNDEPITKANLKNLGDKFFKHPELYIRFEKGSVNVDDETPLGQFFLACFRADTEFKFAGKEINPALNPLVNFTVLLAGDAAPEESEEISKNIEAMKLLLNLSFEKSVKVLNAMGVRTSNPDPSQVQEALAKKITKEAKLTSSITGERHIDMFLRLASIDTEELNLRSLISKARTARIIGKSKGNKYVFGELVLGRKLEEVYQFLKNDENIDIRLDIIENLESNGKNTH